jgi:signal transduction histidine kinase
MLSYLAFVHHGIKSVGNPFTDGKNLAQHCVKQLEALGDVDQFPPRLLILLASPAYLDSLKSEQLLKGVTQVFHKAGHRIADESGDGGVELIGCSVAAVFFDRHIHRKGALLVCLASRLLEARVGVSPDASQDPDKAVESLLCKLNLLTEDGEKVHSFANRTLFTLFPGFGGNKYLAPKLHESLSAQLGRRIPIFGGVASADDPQRIRPGILFANQKVYRNAIVAASVECGTPFGLSLTNGLKDGNRRLNVTELDPQDRRIIRRFSEGKASDVMEQLMAISPVPLLANMALNRDPTIDMPTLEGETLRLTREVSDDEPFHLLITEPKSMQKAFRAGVKQSLDRAYLLNPIAGLGFRCTGLLRHSERIGLNLERDSALIEHDLSLRDSPYDKPFVGGFVDGEAGVDQNGKSVLGNWSNATLAFGDELRFRTPVYRGFEKLADYAGMKAPESQKDWIDKLTQLVYDVGFPGAMLSFCINDQDRVAIVAQSASGSRYKKIFEKVEPYPLDGDDILATVIKTKKWRLILDSGKEKCGSMKAASRENVISQYIAPLEGPNGEVNALLQIDLGDISYDSGLYQSEKIVLEALIKIVSSGLNRTFSWEESKIIRELDQAMSDCLSAETIKQGLQKYLKRALKAFGLREGHIRIAQEDKHRLRLVAGIGDYYEESRQIRSKINFDDRSPIAHAFRHEKIVIVNDPASNKAHQEMCRLLEHEDRLLKREGTLSQKLREMGSYANIPFKSERGERGTIKLISPAPWFFTRFHDNAFNALRHRLGFLLETLRRKKRESFLLGVSPQFSQISDLDDVGTVLANEIERFAKTVKADIASLYLFDEDRKRYIMQAQYGWKNPEWVNVAYYLEEEHWTGETALAGKPRYIRNLFAYYQPFGKDTPRYTVDAFGQKLSARFTVEAIALRLRIANNTLGVLTLYRPIKSGDESGFITTDTDLLQQGADNFASLIGILQATRKEKWRKREHDRRQQVYDAIVPAADAAPSEVGESFEACVCRQVLKSYRAIKASFYKVERAGETPKLQHMKSFSRDPRTEQIVLGMKPKGNKEELVKRAMDANSHNEKKLETERVGVKEKDSHIARRVAMANLVKRACIPLISEKRLIGILDMHWSFDPEHTDLPDYQHGESFLLMLGEVVGSAYGRKEVRRHADLKIEEGKEKLNQSEINLLESEDFSRIAIQITSAYVMQYQHDLRNKMQSIGSKLRSLEENFSNKGDAKNRQLIKELLLLERDTGETLGKIDDIGRKIIEPNKKVLSLKNLINIVVKKEQVRCEKSRIEVKVRKIRDDLSVYVDPELIESAIGNLLDNAIKYMAERPTRVLNISALANSSAGTATIVIKDSGAGMTSQKIDRILKGFFPHNGRASYGVPIANLILYIFGGSLDYKSVKGKGTKTLITLPLNNREENL